jgi:hypothetical protein
MSNTSTWTEAELAAIREWRSIHPKTRGNDSWQSRLMHGWLTGQYDRFPSAWILQSIRNRTDLPNDLTERIALLSKISEVK